MAVMQRSQVMVEKDLKCIACGSNVFTDMQGLSVGNRLERGDCIILIAKKD